MAAVLMQKQWDLLVIRAEGLCRPGPAETLWSRVRTVNLVLRPVRDGAAGTLGADAATSYMSLSRSQRAI